LNLSEYRQVRRSIFAVGKHYEFAKETPGKRLPPAKRHERWLMTGYQPSATGFLVAIRIATVGYRRFNIDCRSAGRAADARNAAAATSSPAGSAVPACPRRSVAGQRRRHGRRLSRWCATRQQARRQQLWLNAQSTTDRCRCLASKQGEGRSLGKPSIVHIDVGA